MVEENGGWWGRGKMKDGGEGWKVVREGGERMGGGEGRVVEEEEYAG